MPRGKYYSRYRQNKKAYNDLVSMDKKIKKVAKAVKDVTEEKYHDKAFPEAEIYNDGTSFTLLSSIDRGDGPSSRDGDSVRFQRLQFKARIIPDADDAYNVVRLIIFRYKGQFGQTPTVAKLLETPTYPGVSPLNFENRSIFHVIHDKTYPTTLDVNGTTMINIDKKLSIKTMYSASTGSEANTVDNGIYAFLISTEATATEAPSVQFISRLLFSE